MTITILPAIPSISLLLLPLEFDKIPKDIHDCYNSMVSHDASLDGVRPSHRLVSAKAANMFLSKNFGSHLRHVTDEAHNFNFSSYESTKC